MARHEIQVGGEIGLPLLAKISAHYKLDWERRAQEHLEAVEGYAGLDPGELRLRLEESEQFRDIEARAIGRVASMGDGLYSDAIARLVAAACDPAKIDESDYAVSQVLKLEPVQLRLFLAFFRQDTDEETTDARMARPAAMAKALSVRDLRDQLELSAGLVDAAAEVLAGLGFIHKLVQVFDASSATGESDDRAMRDEQVWQSASWGTEVYQLIFPGSTVTLEKTSKSSNVVVDG